MIDEPYCLPIDQIANLTMRQVFLLYYRERDSKGIPRPIKQMYDYDDDGNKIDTTKDDFYNLGMALGLSMEELDSRWEEAKKDAC